MNDLKNHLSIGNVILVIKNNAKNKISAIQSEVFCALFDIDDISETTVNNYCTGYRAIGDKFVQKYIVMQNRYKTDKTAFKDVVYNILNILEGIIYRGNINDSTKLKDICIKLYNIAKNDTNVDSKYTNELYALINSNNLYEGFVKIICYAVLENKQPLYEDEKNRAIIELTLENTNISTKDLEEFLSLQFKEGINFNHSINQLVKKNNPYACFDLATMEYRGEVSGKPRYSKSYELFLKASEQNHPAANWMIANMIINKKIGNGSKEEIKLAWKYLKKAESLGSLAATNTIGICYREGIGVKKDIKKAVRYFEKAAKDNYVYAYNNLGKYYESIKNYKKAFKYYLKSADLGESWAANKVGEMYRQGIGVEEDIKKAYEYYSISEDTSIREICYYSKYNLAKYFLLNGSGIANIEKDEERGIELLEEASKENILEASLELLFIYVEYYIKTKEEKYKELVQKYIDRIETNEKYDENIKKEIDEKIKEMTKINSIKIDI